MRVMPRECFEIDKPFNYGSFGNVYKTEIEGKTYCYKEFKKEFPSDIIRNISSFTDEEYSEEFLTPLYMVHTFGKASFSGYLTNYFENLIEIEDVYERAKKILLLKKAKLTIMKFHKCYGRIHGDLNGSNMLFGENDLAYLLDFDSSLRISQPVGSTRSFSMLVEDYLKLYPLDYSVDAYSFNLNTLAILGKSDPFNVLDAIRKGTFRISEENIMTRKLSRELLLENPRKPYSGQYIIDYID
ncbi:MAG: hypothetical protein IJY87_05045 [Bacilli bacterium]|nr:hypothetical protein [Bacilli bacterium]